MEKLQRGFYEIKDLTFNRFRGFALKKELCDFIRVFAVGLR